MSTHRQTIRKAATGQPYALGMLYDCRSDTLIEGLTLWDKKYLNNEKYLHVTQLQSSTYKVECSDTLSSKANLLDVEAGLKLSILGGLIDISGAASYLKDRVSSSLQERVTMKYKCTTISKKLTMEHLGKDKITHPEAFTKDLATHVVTGITYGARAFLTFDRKHESSEMKRNVHAKIDAMVEKIPYVPISAGGKLDIGKKEQDIADNMSCTFYGDFIPDKNPTSYQQAVTFYQNISQQLGENNEKAVPVEVFLLPLTCLDEKAAKLEYTIESDLVEKTTNVFENLHALHVKCNDLLDTKANRILTYHANKIKKIQKLCSRYRTFFQGKIAPLLPEIRGGKANVSKLSELLMGYENSPFSDVLDVATKQEIEIKTMAKYLEYFSVIRFVTPIELQSVIRDPAVKTVACFKIICPTRDHSSEHLERYLENKDIKSEADQTIQPESEDISKLVTNARMFLEFWKANKESDMEFIIAEMSEEVANLTGQINIYESGVLKIDNFDPPICGQPQCTVLSRNSIKVMWEMINRDISDISGFVIKYTDSDNIEKKVKLTDITLTEHTLTDLTPSKSYEIAVCALMCFGSGPYVDAKEPVSLRK